MFSKPASVSADWFRFPIGWVPLRIFHTFYPIHGWIYWNSIMLFKSGMGTILSFLKVRWALYWFLNNFKSICINILFKIGEMPSCSFWKLKWNSKAICLRVLKMNKILKAQFNQFWLLCGSNTNSSLSYHTTYRPF